MIYNTIYILKKKSFILCSIMFKNMKILLENGLLSLYEMNIKRITIGHSTGPKLRKYIDIISINLFDFFKIK
jgi:hypothetical protein